MSEAPEGSAERRASILTAGHAPHQRHGRSHAASGRTDRRSHAGARASITGASDQLDQPLTLDLDIAALAGAFGHRLYDAGVSVTPDQSQRYALSLQLVKPATLRQLYFTTRSIFLTDPDELPIFDRIFALVFDPTGSHPTGYDAEASTYADAKRA